MMNRHRLLQSTFSPGYLSAFAVLLLLSFVTFSCSGRPEGRQRVSNTTSGNVSSACTPSFSADSAYRYVEEQCVFGPRVPGTDAHARCADYLAAHFGRCNADTVIIQRGTTTIYDGSEKPLANIIASFGVDKSRRVMLCAHWDSRPFADEEAYAAHRRQPIVGANDGASGVGVIMEIARQLSLCQPAIGVDLILFDLEDWGAPDWERSLLPDGGWALGSAYWSENPHVRGYSANYGILLDMVGAAGATFYREYLSEQQAGWVNDKVWTAAAELGLNHIFVNRPGGAVTDDHINVLRAGVPCIDIIQYAPDTETGFFDRWHTTRDDLSVIDPYTLNAVGQVVTSLIYK